MNDRPLVSVVVATYNRPEYLRRALASVNAQTWPAVQLLVVNDAGAEVEEVVRPFLVRPHDRYIRRERNAGPAAARNTGLAEATGKYVACLDDDDLWYPEHLSLLITAMEESGAAIASSNAVCVHYVRKGSDYAETKRYVLDEEWDRDRVVLNNYLPPIGFAYTMSCMREAGGFDERIVGSEDMDLWIRMTARHPVLRVRAATCEYRVVDDGTSLTSASQGGYLRNRALIFTKYPEDTVRAADEMIARWLRAERELTRCRARIRELESTWPRRLVRGLRAALRRRGPGTETTP